MLHVSDLTPNVGLFWYLHTEMFARFKNYFVFVFNVHPLIYVVPLTLAFRYQVFIHAEYHIKDDLLFTIQTPTRIFSYSIHCNIQFIQSIPIMD